jgi:hypothetical protein
MLPEFKEFMLLPKEMQATFSELKISSHLRQANIKKSKGFSCLYLFTLIFLLTFHHRTWFQSKFCERKASDLPGKDAVYRFLSTSTYNWRRFLLSLSAYVISLCTKLTKDDRVNVLIVDDSLFERTRSQKVELLSTVYDHVSHKYLKGFQLLTLGWSDGYSFIPCNFSLMTAVKRKIVDISRDIDKRSSGYKRRLEALMDKPTATLNLVKQTLSQGIEADYLLMDSWFTEAPLIKEVINEGLDVIGMVKKTSKRFYQYKGKNAPLHTLITYCNVNQKIFAHQEGSIGSIQVKLNNGIPVKMVFIRHRKYKTEWLAILSTNTSLSDEEIIRIYGYRWDIEVFFKCNKSHLKLNKEFQCRSFDSMIGHTTIVFTRYIFLAWEQRKTNDPKTLGMIFYEYCSEVKDVDFETALKGLLNIVQEIISQGEREMIINTEVIKNQLDNWMATLPNYINGLLGFSLCES